MIETTIDERDTMTAAMERLFSPPTASARVQVSAQLRASPHTSTSLTTCALIGGECPLFSPNKHPKWAPSRAVDPLTDKERGNDVM